MQLQDQHGFYSRLKTISILACLLPYLGYYIMLWAIIISDPPRQILWNFVVVLHAGISTSSLSPFYRGTRSLNHLIILAFERRSRETCCLDIACLLIVEPLTLSLLRYPRMLPLY